MDEGGTWSLGLEENLPEAGFILSHLPEGGWSPGEHFVVLTMNDQEVGRYTFAITSSGSAAPFDEDAFRDVLPAPDDAEGVPVMGRDDRGFVTGTAAAWPNQSSLTPTPTG